MAKPKKTPKKSKKTVTKQRLTNRKLAIKIALALVITFLAYLTYCFITLPPLNDAVKRTRYPSTLIVAENGNEISSYGSVYSDVVHSNELPKYILDAIISTEDRRFYNHLGFDPISFTRAMITNIIEGRYAQGGSTITQQVAKNLFLTPNKTIKRKVQELMFSFWLESVFTKEQILTLYLNRVYLGSGTYGIAAASHKYFQKAPQDINILEASVIAGMLKAPSRYNPIYSKELAIERANIVLDNMIKTRTITEEEKAQALNLRLGAEKTYKVKNANYFADYVFSEINDYVEDRDKDIIVLTTLDQELQENASKILAETIKANKHKNVTQGAIVVMDMFGGIKALVGGVDYNKSQFNRATQALRQPGSAFKPFVYLTALQNGYEREDKIMDVPISIGSWKPENANKKYKGEVTLDYALANSLNLATIYLSQKLDGNDIIKNAKKMGITTPIQNTPSLALGTFEVKVIDLAVAYTTIANGGFANWPYAIKEIYTKNGYQMFQREVSEQNRILDKTDAKKLRKMLNKVITQGTGKRAQMPFFVGGKTGTSQDYRDAWFVGFSDDLVCAVWLGNDNNSPMKSVGGSNLPATIWKKIMLTTE